jgi:hypothetical protein
MKKIIVGLFIIVLLAGMAYSRLGVEQQAQVKLKTLKMIKVTYPNGGETWEHGKIYTIQWESRGISGLVKIMLKWGTGSEGWYTLAASIPNRGSYAYKVPETGKGQSGSQFKIYVMTLDESIKDSSDRHFTIGQAGVSAPLAVAPVRFTKISRLEKLDSPSKMKIRQLEVMAEKKTLESERIIQGWKTLTKELNSKKIFLEESVVRESFDKPIQAARSQAQKYQKAGAFTDTAQRDMNGELQKAKKYLRQIKVLRAANRPIPPLKVKNFASLVNRIKAGQTDIQWDPGEKPVSSDELSDYIKQVETQMEEVRNKRSEFQTLFENFDQKSNQMLNLLSTVLKNMHDMQQAVMRNLR